MIPLATLPSHPAAEAATARRPARANLLDLGVGQLRELAVQLGEPPYRGRQLARWIYRSGATAFGEMSDVPATFRSSLAEHYRIGGASVLESRRTTTGDTEKLLLEHRDGATIETVLMRQQDGRGGLRNTLCLSTQVGCAVGCPFCATGQAGWFRNLTAGEMVEQVLLWSRRLAGEGDRVHNLVYMGMGEPLGNYDAVWNSIRILNDPEAFGLGARHITVSTSGIAPRIERMAREDLQVNLAVSLHAADDRLRDELVPINRQFPLARLIAACTSYVEATNRRITFEYVLIRDVNDSPAQARQLSDLVGGMLCHVNLIPLNPEPSSTYAPPDPRVVDEFAGVLKSRRLAVTVRRERGQEISAACGQLFRGSLQRRSRTSSS